MGSRRSWVAPVCAVAALVCAVTASQPDLPTVLRAPAALVLAFVLPGVVLTELSGQFARMGAFERVAWALGMSIAVVVVVGLGIAAFGAPLVPGTWATALAGVTLTGATMAAIRGPSGATWHVGRVPRIDRVGVALLIVAGLLTLTAVTYVRHEAAERDRPTATQMWATASSDSEVRIGVRSQEPAAASFRVFVEGSDAGSREWRLRLEPGEDWEVAVPVTGDQGPIRARLYKDDPASASVVLREVILWPPFGQS